MGERTPGNGKYMPTEKGAGGGILDNLPEGKNKKRNRPKMGLLPSQGKRNKRTEQGLVVVQFPHM